MKTILLVVLLISRVAFADNLPVFSLQPTNVTVTPSSTATLAAGAALQVMHAHLDDAKDEQPHFIAVLEIPPVESAETTERVQTAKDARGNK